MSRPDEPLRRAAPGAVAEINITPLIDVLLVLLIIFMLVAPVPPRAHEAGVPPQGPGGGQAVVLSADAEVLLVGSDPVENLARLEAVARERLATRADKTVFVKARGVDYGRVVELMDAARAAGAERLGLIPYR